MGWTVIMSKDKKVFTDALTAAYAAPEGYTVNSDSTPGFEIDETNRVVYTSFLTQTIKPPSPPNYVYQVIEEYSSENFLAKFNELADADYSLVNNVQILTNKDNRQIFFALMVTQI